MKADEIPRLLARRFWLVLLLTAIGGGLGAAYAGFKTPTYTAKAYVVATADAGDPMSALNFAQAYGRVATSGPVLARAGTLLGADRSGLDSVTASTSPDAPVVEIDATGPSARHTADVANAVATALAGYGTDRKAVTHVGLTLLAGALTPAEPSSPKPPLELLVGAAGGLLIGGLVLLAGAGPPAEPRPRERADNDDEDAIDRTAELPRPPYDAPAAIGSGGSAADLPALGVASAAALPVGVRSAGALSAAGAFSAAGALSAGGAGEGAGSNDASDADRRHGRGAGGDADRGQGAGAGGGADRGHGGGAGGGADSERGGGGVGGAARVPHQAGADGRLAKNGAEALLAPVSGGAENGTGSSAKAVNGKVYAPGPTVGRAAVAGMEDEDD